MPKLDTSLHLDMLSQGKKRTAEGKFYGMQWGDPNKVDRLRYVRDRYILPFVNDKSTAIEIGPGGGRWTQFLQDFERIYVVDYHQELLDELAKNFEKENTFFVKNNGTDFPNIADSSIDFVFSFGVFVHLDIEIIDAYLEEIHRVMKNGAYAVLQYSDKTKDLAFRKPSFSVNTPDLMRSMIRRRGLSIRDENTTVLPHSALVCFTKDSKANEYFPCCGPEHPTKS